MRIELRFGARRAGLACVLGLAIFAACVVAPERASAGFFDFLFPNQQGKQAAPSPPQANSFADPFGLNPQAPPPPPAPAAGSSRSSSSHCVRMCDGKYFPLPARSGASPTQVCQAFCPASTTRVFFGATIDNAISMDGERYSEITNAFAYRKQLSADCTCNGRSPAGLVPLDISLDATLRPGDVIATATGLVAYSGSRIGSKQTAEFTPVANYPGLTADIRTRLGEMKVSPVTAEVEERSTQDSPAR